jgi:hypothetical protein
LCNNGKCTQGLGAGQDDIYTVPGRVNYIVAKGDSRINALSFMQKTMQKLVAHIRGKILEMLPTSITISPQTREVHRNCDTPCDYTHTERNGKPYVTLHIS